MGPAISDNGDATWGSTPLCDLDGACCTAVFAFRSVLPARWWNDQLGQPGNVDVAAAVHACGRLDHRRARNSGHLASGSRWPVAVGRTPGDCERLVTMARSPAYRDEAHLRRERCAEGREDPGAVHRHRRMAPLASVRRCATDWRLLRGPQ